MISVAESAPLSYMHAEGLWRPDGNKRVTIGPVPSPKGDPFEALGDPNRRAIVEVLRDGPQPVRVIAERLPISRPAVSRHLRLLQDAGLVSSAAAGTRRLYRLDDEGVEAVRAYLEVIWGDVATRFTLAAENLSDRHRRGVSR
jgi:DNA-binding transcriptional ArsR family regulator